MFEKAPAIPLRATPAPPYPGRTKPATPDNLAPTTALGADLTFEGRIAGSGALQIDGKFKGDVEVAHLLVGAAGSIEGNISAKTVMIRGRVVGNIRASSVHLFSTAHVDGDITYQQIGFEVGAYFQGRCEQQSQEASIRLVRDNDAPEISDEDDLELA